MTKTQTPEPVAWEYRDDADMRQPGSGTRLISFVRMAGMANERPLVYSDQNETYANDRVRGALEDALIEVMRCKTSGIIRNDTVDKCADAIRALIPATK